MSKNSDVSSRPDEGGGEGQDGPGPQQTAAAGGDAADHAASGRNPFVMIGGRVPDLVRPERLASVLNSEAMQHLVEAAKVPAGLYGGTQRQRRDWFAEAVFAAVRNWMGAAHQPPVREVAATAVELKLRLYDALSSRTAAAVAAVADSYRELIEAGWQPYGTVAPTLQAIRAGDTEALALLFGILPVRATPWVARHPYGRGAAFIGANAKELQQRGRPREVRWEQLAVRLGMVYELATGRLPGRGERSPFTSFFRLLVALLTERDLDERGDRLLRRVAKRRKAPPSPKAMPTG